MRSFCYLVNRLYSSITTKTKALKGSRKMSASTAENKDDEEGN
jgi:hypothetical protein